MLQFLKVIPAALGVVSNVLQSADRGVQAVAQITEEKPKQSAAVVTVLGWFGLDQASMQRIAEVLTYVAALLQ